MVDRVDGGSAAARFLGRAWPRPEGLKGLSEIAEAETAPHETSREALLEQSPKPSTSTLTFAAGFLRAEADTMVKIR
jgi:hypothetical protein